MHTNANSGHKTSVLILSFLVVIVCYISFLLSFFPIRKAVPDFAKHHEFPNWLLPESGNDSHPRPAIGRLVILVIDALRVDFVLQEESEMKYISELFQKSEALGYVAKTDPPTVTLPRIKALTTGSIPGFIDIALNFDSNTLVDDNVITQMKRAGKRILFYGDDTWISLFPDHFSRSEGTSSFFVADYTEVDNNVTRQLPDELRRTDWDVMILHYLGLDHIGHLAGPKSPLIGPKLNEMDNIVRTIHTSLSNMNKGLPSLLVVCGDHGMSDHGSHGGASPSEILVPMVFISPAVKKCPKLKDESRIQQIDLAPTLSILMGLPIPQNSLGHVITDILFGYSLEEKARALWLNSQQVLKVLHHNIPDYENEASYIQCQIAFNSHFDWLKNLSVSSSEKYGFQIIDQYKDCLVAMTTRISSSLTKYHMYGMIVSIVLLWLVFTVALLTALQAQSLIVDWQYLPFALLFSVIAVFSHVTVCTSQSNHSDILCQNSPPSWLLQASLLTCTFWMSLRLPGLVHSPCWSFVIKHQDITSVFLLFGTVLHTFSLISSSLIEEEHQTWYFYSVSVHVIILAKLFFKLVSPGETTQQFAHSDEYTTVENSKRNKKYNQSKTTFSQHTQSVFPVASQHEKRIIQNSEQIYGQDTMHFKHIDKSSCQLMDKDNIILKEDILSEQKTYRMNTLKNIMSVLFVLVLSRLTRSWNQTGNKWLDTPDIGDWLDRPEKKLFLSAAVALSLMSMVPARWCLQSLTENIIFTAGCLTIYMFRSATGAVWFPGLYFHPSKGLSEARVVYILVFILVIKSILEKWRAEAWSGSHRLYSGLQSACTLLMALLLRTHNIPLVAIVTYQELLINSFLPNCRLSVISLSLYCWWMGQATFFFQGNSNSISTVDAAAGFIGVDEYRPIFIGTLIAVHTYIGPIFWFLVLMKYICQHSEQGINNEYITQRLKNSIQTVCNWLLLCRVSTLAVYTVLVTLQRYHLFVWTVFSPKLLYEGSLTAVTSLLCIVTMVMKG